MSENLLPNLSEPVTRGLLAALQNQDQAGLEASAPLVRLQPLCFNRVEPLCFAHPNR